MILYYYIIDITKCLNSYIIVFLASNLSSNFIEVDKLSKSVDSDSLLQYGGNQFIKSGNYLFKKCY